MTRSVPGGQRGSSKGPAEMSALWEGGNNSATFHHFIVISLYLSSTQDTREEGQEVSKRQRKGGERRLSGGTRGSWSFERGEVWIVTFKKKGITQQRSHPHLWDKQKANWSDKRTKQKREKWKENRKANPCLQKVLDAGNNKWYFYYCVLFNFKPPKRHLKL